MGYGLGFIEAWWKRCVRGLDEFRLWKELLQQGFSTPPNLQTNYYLLTNGQETQYYKLARRRQTTRETIETRCSKAWSNAELLAILIGTGYAETDAVMVMKQVLSQCNNNLNALGKMTASELMSFKGIGEAKAVTILAACELGKRRAQSTL